MKLKDPPADMDVPQEIEIRLSNIDSEKMGLWCKKAIKKGSRFGPFVGEKALEVDERMDPTYIWEIVDVETKEFLFYINATDPRRCNWMRYINCARYFEEQNILSQQDGIDIFYEAIKDIEPGEELLTWYEKTPLRKRKGKRRSASHVRRAKTSPEASTTSSAVATSETSTASVQSEAVASISQRGRRRSAKKYWQIEETADPREAAEAAGELYGVTDDEPVIDDARLAASDVGKSVEPGNADKPEDAGRYFQFELLPVHTGSRNRLGRKMFECDVCAGVYRHSFSLKRHYLRNHINRRYISRVDALNCNLMFCGDDDDDDDVAAAAGRRRGLRRSASSADAVSGGDDRKRATESASVSPESGSSASRCGDDGSTLQMDVEEIDAGADVADSDGDKPRRKANDFAGLYRCYVCERHVDSVAELKAHVCDSRVTGGTGKRFACRHCQMQFRHRQNLVRHELVHTGAKPYTCEKCNKCFPTLTNRRRHERIHGGCRLACSLCASSFTQTGDLKKHIRRQHPESYRACAFCPRYFTADAQLSMHLRRAHPGADLDANRRHAGARRDARCAALEADRAESRRLGAAASAAAAADQFACTICCKNFTDYANMCRHRRLAHGCGVRSVDPDASSSDGDDVQGPAAGTAAAVGTSTSTPASMDTQQAYFSSVAKNIAANLSHHVEGKAEHLSRAGSHIRWRQGSTAASSSTAEPPGHIQLEEFNFPRGFKIRSSLELCGVAPSSSDADKDDCSPANNDKDGAKNGSVSTEPDHERLKDPVLINVPDVRQCAVCRMVFHSSMSLEQHMANHQHTDELTVATADASLEKPLDLSSPVVKDCESFQLPDVPHLLVEMADPQTVERSVSKCRKFVCLVCLREYRDSAELLLHQAERHPNIDCRHIEVDQDFESVDIGMRPRTVGVLNVSSSQLPALPDDGTTTAIASTAVTCTKCRQNFATRAALHAHIVDCGDYWRSLSERLTWVFVLRGSELPAQQSSTSSSSSMVAARKQQGRRCGKFRWGSSASHESVRRQMQRMLIKQHVGVSASSSAAAADSRRASARISSQRGADSPPPTEAPTVGISAPRDSRKPLPPPPPPPPHALRRHARRRVAAGGQTTNTDHTTSDEVVAVKCERCDAAFDSTAERDAHAAGCSDQVCSGTAGDERNADTKDHDDNDDDDIDPTKHLCIYCGRQFTFLRALRRHVVDGCSVRRDLVERQEYVDDEWETELKAAAGVGRTSTGGSTDVTDDATGDAADGVRRSGGKRRRRCKNWSSSKSKSRKSARSSGDDGDDSLFGWEDAYLSTWGKDEREDITRRDEQIRRQTSAAVDDDAPDVKSTTALAQLLTTDFLVNDTRTSSDDLDALVQRSSSSVTKMCLATSSAAADTNVAMTTKTTTTSSSSGMSFAVKLELLTGSQDNHDKPTSPHVDDQSQQVADVVLVVDEIPKNDDEDVGTPGLDSSGTSSTGVSDTGPAVELVGDKEMNDDSLNDDTEMHVTDDVTSGSQVANGSESAVSATENCDADAACPLKARRRRGRRLTMIKRKKS